MCGAASGNTWEFRLLCAFTIDFSLQLLLSRSVCLMTFQLSEVCCIPAEKRKAGSQKRADSSLKKTSWK